KRQYIGQEATMSDTRRVPALDSILQDLRYTFRTLRRDSGFTTFAILIVGLGIGASATVFSVVNTLLLRPLPFRDPDRLSGVPVSENFFQVLGIQPQLGRLFTAEECKWHGPKAVLLSHGLWERRFGSDPGLVGRTLTINDEPVTVAGVLPASFDLAS